MGDFLSACVVVCTPIIFPEDGKVHSHPILVLIERPIFTRVKDLNKEKKN